MSDFYAEAAWKDPLAHNSIKPHDFLTQPVIVDPHPQPQRLPPGQRKKLNSTGPSSVAPPRAMSPMEISTDARVVLGAVVASALHGRGRPTNSSKANRSPMKPCQRPPTSSLRTPSRSPKTATKSRSPTPSSVAPSSPSTHENADRKSPPSPQSIPCRHLRTKKHVHPRTRRWRARVMQPRTPTTNPSTGATRPSPPSASTTPPSTSASASRAALVTRRSLKRFAIKKRCHPELVEDQFRCLLLHLVIWKIWQFGPPPKPLSLIRILSKAPPASALPAASKKMLSPQSRPIPLPRR